MAARVVPILLAALALVVAVVTASAFFGVLFILVGWIALWALGLILLLGVAAFARHRRCARARVPGALTSDQT